MSLCFACCCCCVFVLFFSFFFLPRTAFVFGLENVQTAIVRMMIVFLSLYICVCVYVCACLLHQISDFIAFSVRLGGSSGSFKQMSSSSLKHISYSVDVNSFISCYHTLAGVIHLINANMHPCISMSPTFPCRDDCGLVYSIAIASRSIDRSRMPSHCRFRPDPKISMDTMAEAAVNIRAAGAASATS
jgi:hypothetical protein